MVPTELKQHGINVVNTCENDLFVLSVLLTTKFGNDRPTWIGRCLVNSKTAMSVISELLIV